MLVDRREALTRRRVQTVDRLQALLAELLPGQAKKDITTGQAKAMLASVRPRDIAGKTRRRIAAEELAELVAVEAKMKKATAELKAMVLARGSHLMDLRGVGPVVAARILADVGDVDPVRRPEPVRVLDRHRTPGRLLRRAVPAPALAGREPAGQPHDPHRRDQPDPPRHRGPGLLPAQARRREAPARSDPLPQAADLRRDLPPARRRRRGRGQARRGPGRALRGDSRIQRGRLPPAHRHFGSATSRDPHPRRYARPPPTVKRPLRTAG